MASTAMSTLQNDIQFPSDFLTLPPFFLHPPPTYKKTKNRPRVSSVSYFHGENKKSPENRSLKISYFCGGDFKFHAAPAASRRASARVSVRVAGTALNILILILILLAFLSEFLSFSIDFLLISFSFLSFSFSTSFQFPFRVPFNFLSFFL